MPDIENKTYENLISSQKLTYFTNNYAGNSFEAYLINIKISKSFYIWLHFFEIILRNKVAKHLSSNWEDWYLDNSEFYYGILEERQQIQLEQAHLRLKQDEKDITENNIISELNFGFWTSLFNSTYSYDIWKNSKFKMVFPGARKRETIGNLSQNLNDIRDLRNRISHYEQILSYEPLEKYNLIKTYFKYLLTKKDYDLIERIYNITPDCTIQECIEELHGLYFIKRSS